MNRALSPVLALIFAVTGTSLAAQGRAITAEDFYRFTLSGDVAVAPGGDLVAFTVTTINEAENDRELAIWIQRVENGRPAGSPFRFTDPTENSSQPSWAPDGSVLSFSSRRDDDQNTAWFIRVTAPGGEAYHIEGVDATPTWSPDGEWIAMVRAPADDAESDGERAGWIAPDGISRTLDPERFDGRLITHLRYKRNNVFEPLPHPSILKKDQLFIVPATGGEARQLTHLPFNVRDATWSSDGGFLAFVGNEFEDVEIDPPRVSDIYAVSAQGGEPYRITDLPGAESAPALAHTGRRIAFLYSAERGAETELYTLELDSTGRPQGTPRSLTEEWPLQPGQPVFTSDDSAIRFSTGVGASTHLFEVSVAGGEVRQITEGDRSLGSFSASSDGSLIGYTSTDPTHPNEVFVAAGDGTSERRVTDFNDDLLAEVAVTPAERLSWRVADGTEVEGWVIKPRNYQEGEKYPMILSIHGGPHSVYRHAFSQVFQMLSGEGFFVMYINPRGSSGYGNDFMYSIRGEWGVMDEEDFIKGVETALATYDDIDPERLGVTGGSYGGYMSNWLTARTDLFRASVTRASIANWESLMGSSDSGQPDWAFFGTSFQERERYRRLSPISYVENVTAPTLIIHGEFDYRTPLGEAEQWYAALKKNRVPVEFARYPRSAHGIREPWLVADSYERTRSWFAHWLAARPRTQPD